MPAFAQRHLCVKFQKKRTKYHFYFYLYTNLKGRTYEKNTNYVKSMTAIALLLIFACSVMEYFDSMINPVILDFIQALAGLFLALFCLPVLLYRYNTNRRNKILKKVSK